ncbi:geranylgeranylglycerol-phosphate geranylgeranyltransferase [Palaeococcus ferrophilus]|uniref:geranylgeranylglycerol-phosphate geranylgeranyltransferase n=1 Tax=Palaeococcus ferrophilus TaxID=83868 RepID=UPI00064E454A|nr:geranylgeranylglycerol-phosphate geranylgeranyltransferase [Palaeococcus ferrophilus]
MEVKAFIEITRPHNALMAGLVGVLGAIISLGHVPEAGKLALVFLVVTLGTAGGNTINDYFDYEIDRINRPDRPIPRGAMGRETARLYAVALFLLGIGLAYFLNLWAFIITLVAYALMYVYAWKLKPLPLVGNLTVSFLTGITPVFGAIAFGRIGLAGYLSLSAFLVNLSREILKDIEDVEGDRAMGARTLPIVWGIGRSSKLAALFAVLTILSSLLPLTTGVGRGYWPIVFVDLLLLKVALDAWSKPSIETASKGQKRLKVAIFLAILVFLAGSLT